MVDEPEKPADPGVESQSTWLHTQSIVNTSIGSCRILRRISEGGMGEVYLAEQESPLRRLVAVKFIKIGSATPQILARFDVERQALALMNHANIGSILDAGVAEDGRPYFVMEYVTGQPIHAYCEDRGLSLNIRLELFLQVCRAVQHAHSKGVLHRDIKSSNVLVASQGDHPIVKVIDFGLAKAIGMPLTERPLFTEAGSLLGTPEYMSPEQAASGGIDVDVRTDVYSLGVLLYELLTGRLPFDSTALRKAGVEGMLRMIREFDPPRPSVRVLEHGPAAGTSNAHDRGVRNSFGRKLRGDLDWITLRAMAKDRSKRYESAAELAADIERHLRNLPVQAGPPSLGYRLHKFAVRRRVALLLMTVLTAILLVVGIPLTLQIRKTSRAEDEQRRRAESALAELGEQQLQAVRFEQRMARLYGQRLFREKAWITNGEKPSTSKCGIRRGAGALACTRPIIALWPMGSSVGSTGEHNTLRDALMMLVEGGLIPSFTVVDRGEYFEILLRELAITGAARHILIATGMVFVAADTLGSQAHATVCATTSTRFGERRALRLSCSGGLSSSGLHTMVERISTQLRDSLYVDIGEVVGIDGDWLEIRAESGDRLAFGQPHVPSHLGSTSVGIIREPSQANSDSAQCYEPVTNAAVVDVDVQRERVLAIARDAGRAVVGDLAILDWGWRPAAE